MSNTAQQKHTPRPIKPWRNRPDLMQRLAAVQNRNTSVDIMTFAGFMDTEAELEAYVSSHEAKGGAA